MLPYPHTHTHTHTTQTWIPICSCSTHILACIYMHACIHMRRQDAFYTPQPEKLRCTTVGVSAACKVTGPQNVPWDLGMRCLLSGTPPCRFHVPSKEAARMPAFLSSKTLRLCQGSRGRERCTARAQMAEQPQAGTFSQAFKKNTFFPA